MFFLKKDVNIDLEEDILKKSNISLLIENVLWKKLFNNGHSSDMERLSDELKEIAKRKRQIENEITKIQALKRKYMAKIVYVSNELNINESIVAEKELESLKEEMEKMNERIESLLEELQNISINIKEKNLLLLKATVKYSYEGINNGEKKLKELDKIIDDMRKKLNEAREEKEKTQQSITLTYNFLHSLLGYEETEKLDKELLK
ncbi:hypothetical protein [Alkalithermobacter paradoxus]|uniref:Chromosome partition protein Smc n=1 Tax=Alkalithermobacter paradoxus TaxID=29349 RepID=A0A1V4I5L2_9FIRM|nr:hypothetical protein CLOTH_15590 [[Clostridium] thermoalcaliphilum]